jgi:hypothetical protein
MMMTMILRMIVGNRRRGSLSIDPIEPKSISHELCTKAVAKDEAARLLPFVGHSQILWITDYLSNE